MRNLVRGLLAALTFAAFAAFAQEPQFENGKQYKPVKETAKADDLKRILVQEFFWYGCPHCYAFDPTIEAWKKTKPADVDFVRVPNSLGRPVGLMHSKTFYTIDALNLADPMHKAVFDAIHRDHVPLENQQQMQEFFTKTAGVKPEVFNATFGGFAVDSQVRRAEALTQQFGIAAVPTVVVGGAYYTNAGMAGDFTKLIDCINFLIDKVRKERAGK
jgi:thiol:disulfide interchange protein DsbA